MSWALCRNAVYDLGFWFLRYRIPFMCWAVLRNSVYERGCVAEFRL
jgi:hypothetical protein